MRHQLVRLFFYFLALSSLGAQERKLLVDKRENLLLLEKFNSDNAEEAKNLIQAAEVLIRKNISQKNKDILIANKASYYLTLIRVDLLRSPKMELSSQGHSYIHKVEEALSDLSSRPQTSDFGSNIYLMRGLLNLYKNESYIENFTTAIRMNPSSATAAWMSFMLAEYFFEKEDYLQAKAAYLKYFAKNNSKQREFATYKLAWCMISLKDYPQAESYLARLLKEFPKSSLGADPVKDLAYVSTLHRNDEHIVSLAKSILAGNPEQQLEYLMTVVSYRELRQQLKLNSALLAALSRLEGFKAIQYKYHLAVLRSLSREYASKNHFAAFSEARKHFTKAIPKEAQETYQLQTEKMIKGYYETYTAKVKSPEAWTKKELNGALRSLLSFHLKGFPASPIREQVLTAQTELCTQVKDYKCMLESYVLVLQDKRFVAKHETAALEICKIWDELYKKNPDKFRKKSIISSNYFVRSFSKSSHATAISLRLAEYHIDAKNYAQAVAVLERTFINSKSVDVFYRLQSARFKDSQFSDILKDERIAAHSHTELLEIRREAALQQAVLDKKAGNLKAYENSVEVYLASKAQPEKARMVRKDFLLTLLAEKDFDKLKEVWAKVESGEKLHDDYKEVVNGLWLTYFKKGDFAAASQVLPSTKNSAYLYLDLLNKIATGVSFDTSSFSKLEESQKLYVQSLLLIKDPSGLWAYFEANSRKLSASEKQLALWAYRLSTSKMEVSKNAQTFKVFGNSFAYSESEQKLTSLNKQIASLQMPKTKNMERFAKELEFVLGRVKKLRKAFATDMDKLSLAHRASLLKNMAALEDRIAKFILSAPVPSLLSPAEVAEYKKGLEESASEYEQQSKENLAAADALELKQGSATQSLPSNPNWPSEKYAQAKYYQQLQDLSSKRNAIAALALWDLHQGEKVQDKEKYLRIKLSLLRKSWEQSPVLRNYLAEELKANGYSGILNEWGMVAHVQ